MLEAGRNLYPVNTKKIRVDTSTRNYRRDGVEGENKTFRPTLKTMKKWISSVSKSFTV